MYVSDIGKASSVTPMPLDHEATVDSPFHCDIEGCDRVYARKGDFNRHRRSHNGPVYVSCIQFMTASCNSIMVLHPRTCTICNKSFARVCRAAASLLVQ